VNVGSMFGSIAFAWHAAYSASKYALRGFSEALRRELAGSGVGVTYVAPRAVRTPLNPPEVYRMAEQIRMKMDDPEPVARRIVEAIERDRKEAYLGFPESIFVRVNALLPRLVDRALRRQNSVMRTYMPQR
jgi:short-subunit dehydrogenase